MADDENGIVLTWLNDAYSIENALIHILERHAKEAKDRPQLQTGLNDHLDQTRRHAELVAGRITALGGEPSAHKGLLDGVIAPMQKLLSGAEDEKGTLANSISDYAAENFEIATYRALMTAAEDTGDTDTAQVCRQILSQEQKMAQWLDEQLPPLVEGIIRGALPAQS